MADPSAYSPFGRMLLALGDIFAEEGRPGGREAADALRAAARREVRRQVPPHPLVPRCKEALAMGTHPAAQSVIDAMPYIAWHYSGLEDGRIPPAISRSLVTAELIGPTGHVYHPTVKAGLFMQSAGLDYVTRIHEAEETFFMLGGHGVWFAGDAPGISSIGGDYIFHPSNIPHRSVTEAQPLIAAWRWTGEIGYDRYSLTGMEAARA